MAVPRHALTPEVQKKVCELVRAGMDVIHAAAACGVPEAFVARWLRAGRGRRPDPAYRDFAENVQVARDSARGYAEAQVYASKPDLWLRLGPGRGRPGRPWGPGRRPGKDGGGRSALLREVGEVLAAFPEAREAVARAFGGAKNGEELYLPDDGATTAEVRWTTAEPQRDDGPVTAEVRPTTAEVRRNDGPMKAEVGKTTARVPVSGAIPANLSDDRRPSTVKKDKPAGARPPGWDPVEFARLMLGGPDLSVLPEAAGNGRPKSG